MINNLEDNDREAFMKFLFLNSQKSPCANILERAVERDESILSVSLAGPLTIRKEFKMKAKMVQSFLRITIPILSYIRV